MRRRRSIALGRVLVSALVCLPAAALPSYEIVTLGLVDFEHTRSDGYQSSVPGVITATGYVTGSSDRYDGGARPLGHSAWLFDIAASTTTRLGYSDAPHTRDDGWQHSESQWVTESGYVFGISERYRPGDDDPEDVVGTSAWVYDAHAGTTTRLGYFEAGHIGPEGFQRSSVAGANESGYAVGSSDRYASTTTRWLGNAAWVYDAGAGTTTRLGYFDAEHTRSDGFQTSSVHTLTESGYAIGTSARWNGSTNTGNAAWLHEIAGATTTRLGFFGAGYTRSDGHQTSFVRGVTDSGDVIGHSYRYTGIASSGVSAWYYDSGGGTTTRIGLFGYEHSSDSGYQTSNVSFVTESGYAAGSSDRFFTATSGQGQSAWIFDASTGTTSRIGLFDDDHTSIARLQYSAPVALTGSGYVIGRSHRYHYTGTAFLGQSAWLYGAGAGTTTRLGYSDAAHTGADGFQFSQAERVTETGYVVGRSIRYAGEANVGTSAWLHDAGAATTTRLGYFDAIHTRIDGFQSTTVDHLTESGYAAGGSDRFAGGSEPLGMTSWIYRASDQSQQQILLSERSDGYAFSSISFLAEDGLALGSYELFDGNDTSLGYRAFAWTPDEGTFDLGALVLGGLKAAGWDHLSTAIRALGLAQIAGQGRLQSGGDLAYLLLAVPEPGTGLLLAVGLVALTAQRRRTLRAAA